MTEKRRSQICIYCDHWQNGGVEAYLMNLFRFWDFEKMDCELVVSEVSTDLYDDELTKLGIRRSITLVRAYRSPILRILHNLTAFQNHVRANRYDVIYLNLSNSFTMIYAWMAKRAGIAVRVVHSHCSGIQPGLTRPVKQIGHWMGQRLFLNSVNCFFACSELAARWLFGDTVDQKDRIRYIPNAVDISKFLFNNEKREEMRRSLGIDRRWVVGTVGRLAGEKNPLFLLQAFIEVKKIRPDAFLLMIGEGDLRPQIEQMITERELTGDVLLYGSTRQVAQMLWAMDVFCLPSRFEGNPVSVIEAQAAGCMCLVSDRVTEQCKVSDNVRFLPIDQGLGLWAEAISNTTRICTPQTAAQQVAEHGYDAERMSKKVQETFSYAIDEVKKQPYSMGGSI